MENKVEYITVVDGLDRETRIPKAGLEQYKKQMADWRQTAKKDGASAEALRCLEIKEVKED